MVEYQYYLGAYRGCSDSIPETEWPMFEGRAGDQLAMYRRIYTVTAPDENAEKNAICAMADAMAYFVAAQNGQTGTQQSASIGSISVSYGGGGAVDLSPKAQERELLRCARQYLEIRRGVG